MQRRGCMVQRCAQVSAYSSRRERLPKFSKQDLRPCDVAKLLPQVQPEKESASRRVRCCLARARSVPPLTARLRDDATLGTIVPCAEAAATAAAAAAAAGTIRARTPVVGTTGDMLPGSMFARSMFSRSRCSGSMASGSSGFPVGRMPGGGMPRGGSGGMPRGGSGGMPRGGMPRGGMPGGGMPGGGMPGGGTLAGSGSKGGGIPGDGFAGRMCRSETSFSTMVAARSCTCSSALSFSLTGHTVGGAEAHWGGPFFMFQFSASHQQGRQAT